MRKLLALLLTAWMLLSFASCSMSMGSIFEKGNETEPVFTTGEENSEPEVSVGKMTEKGGVSEGTAAPIENEKKDTETKEPVKRELSFTEMLAFENSKCSVWITDVQIHPDDWDSLVLKVRLENKSADKNYIFSLDNASINGVKCRTFFSSKVAAGKKANEKISLPADELAEYGILDYTDIELFFRVYDSDDWSAEDVAVESVHVYPYGKEAASVYTREAQPQDQILVDNEYITAVAIGYTVDEFGGYSVQLFLKNKTAGEVWFRLDNASINGFMMDPYYAYEVAAGQSAFSPVTWSSYTLKENDITDTTDIEEIEFRIRAYDAEDWSLDDYARETVTLKP